MWKEQNTVTLYKQKSFLEKWLTSGYTPLREKNNFINILYVKTKTLFFFAKRLSLYSVSSLSCACGIGISMVCISIHLFSFIYWEQPSSNYFAQINKGVFMTSATQLYKSPFAYPAGDPSLQVTERFFKKCSLMSSSSFCGEQVYSDCAKFCNWTKKSSVFAFTIVKSNGMLSTASSRSLLVRGWRSRRLCARAPGRLFASTGAPVWMRSSSMQERTMDRPVELFITPRFHGVLNSNEEKLWLGTAFWLKRWKPLEQYHYHLGKSAEGAQVTVPHGLHSVRRNCYNLL